MRSCYSRDGKYFHLLNECHYKEENSIMIIGDIRNGLLWNCSKKLMKQYRLKIQHVVENADFTKISCLDSNPSPVNYISHVTLTKSLNLCFSVLIWYMGILIMNLSCTVVLGIKLVQLL